MAVFLIHQLGIADRAERIQALESVLELPRLGGPLRARAEAGPSCRPARWPPRGWTPNCSSLAWPRRKNWSCSRKRKRTAPGTPTTRIASGCSPWPTSCGGCSTTSCRAWAVCGRSRCGRPANCWSSAAISTSTSPARTCKSRKGVIFRHLLRLILLVGELQAALPAGRGTGPLAGRLGRHRLAAHRKLPPRGPDQHRSGPGGSGGGGRAGGERGMKGEGGRIKDEGSESATQAIG